jgi:hypothetical protein
MSSSAPIDIARLFATPSRVPTIISTTMHWLELEASIEASREKEEIKRQRE